MLWFAAVYIISAGRSFCNTELKQLSTLERRLKKMLSDCRVYIVVLIPFPTILNVDNNLV